MKKLLMSIALVLPLFVYSQINPVVKDSAYCELYFSLNDNDAINHYFNLNLNKVFVTKLTFANRLIYRIYSTGEVLISDNNHEPFATIEAKPNSKYYFRLSKKFGGRYFKMEQFKTEIEIQEYFHFYFWVKYSDTPGSDDRGLTIEMTENHSNPICTSK